MYRVKDSVFSFYIQVIYIIFKCTYHISLKVKCLYVLVSLNFHAEAQLSALHNNKNMLSCSKAGALMDA